MAKNSDSSDGDESNESNDKMTLISHVIKNDTWIIESGCSDYMTGDKSKFEHLEHYDGGSFKFGNDEPCYMQGKGCITLKNDLICGNSYWSEELKHNFLSVAQLNNIGLKVEFRNRKSKLLGGDGNLVGTSNQIRGNIFYLDLAVNSCFIAQVEETLVMA